MKIIMNIVVPAFRSVLLPCAMDSRFELAKRTGLVKLTAMAISDVWKVTAMSNDSFCQALIDVSVEMAESWYRGLSEMQ